MFKKENIDENLLLKSSLVEIEINVVDSTYVSIVSKDEKIMNQIKNNIIIYITL